MDDGDPTILRMGIAKENPATYYDIQNTPRMLAKEIPHYHSMNILDYVAELDIRYFYIIQKI